MYRLAVLASGNGSNLQAILDATGQATPAPDARVLDGVTVTVVASDQPDAYALERAAQAGVPTLAVARRPGEERPEYDARLAAALGPHDPDLVVLAGFMRILTAKFLGAFPDRVINLHPALPGELPGTHAIERAWQEALAGERRQSGVMVHLVPDEGVDCGPVLASTVVPIHLDDTLLAFEARVHAAEHRLLVDTIRQLATAATTTD